VALSPEVVETNLPAYGWRGFIDHQLRWPARSATRAPGATPASSSPTGWLGLLNLLASGLSPLSLWLLG